MNPLSLKVVQDMILTNSDRAKLTTNEKVQVTAINQTLQAMKDYKFQLKQERLRKVLEARRESKK